MFSFESAPALQRSRRGATLRFDTLEERVVPVLSTGVNIIGFGSLAFPASGNTGAVGPNHFVQMTTGSFSIYDKTGSLIQTKTDDQFWQDAGQPSQGMVGLGMPRVVYDQLSSRWFVMEINLPNTNNEVFVARSDTSDPTGTWKSVHYTGMPSEFASFPTLGVDANGVYIGTANFFQRDIAIPLNVTLTKIPKADLLLATPTLANMTRFDQAGSASNMGWAPQVATNFASSPTAASIVSTHWDTFGLINYTELTGTTLGPTSNLATVATSLPGKIWQPGDTTTAKVSGGDDDRYAGAIYQVGNLIYAVQPISVDSNGVGTTSGTNTTDAIHLVVINDTTNQIVAEGVYWNASYDYSFPSVAANALGDIVIAFNRSGKSADGFIGAFAVDAHINGSNIIFGQLTALRTGLSSYHQQGVDNESWGPNSAISIDPTNPLAFWTSQEVALSNVLWGTQITQVFVAPSVTNVTSTTANGTYGVGANISITITFSRPVVVTGAPQLALNSGGTATYASGSGTNTLTFTYTVAAGQLSADLDYSSTGALTLNGGSIIDKDDSRAAGLLLPSPGSPGSLGANKNIVISTGVTGVSGVSSTTANGTYSIGANIAVTVTFSSAVVVTGSPQLALNSGGTATYSSGSGTTTLTFTYTVAAGQNSGDLDYTSTGALTLNGGTIKDQATSADANLTLATPGAAGSLGANKNIVIDTAPASVAGVSSTTANGTYGVGASIAITVTFDKAVTVTGSPQLALNSGGTATYASGTGTAILTFTYTVAAGQSSADLDYTSTGALTLNGGTINTTNNGQSAGLTLPAPGAAGSLGANKNIVIDTVPASVTGVNSTTADGTYGVGASISITVTFNKAVTVTGSPQLALNSGGTATYASGTGTTTLTFNYTVAAGQSSADLDYTSTTALTLNGGTINTTSNGQSASLTLPAPGAAGSLGANKNIVIDNGSASVTGVTSPTPNGTYAFGAVIDITIKFNRVVNVTGTPLLALNSGGTASYLSGSGTDTLTFRYTVGSGESATDLDYTSAGALSLNGGTIKDTTGANATLTLPAPGSAGSLGANKNLLVDSIGPTILQFRVLFGSKWYNVMGSSRFDLPWQVKAVRVVFSEPVYSANLHSLGGLTATSFTGLRTRILTWNFPAISKGSFNATLASTGVNTIKDIAGNPIAAFGQAFKVLYGDFDGNGVVDAADEAGIRAFIAAPYQLSPTGYNIFADLSGDGIVNLIDVGITRTRKGQTLP